MTNVQEAKLSREAEICYATIALATDYDCWHSHAEDVTVDMVIAILKKNVDTAKGIIKESTSLINSERKCHCPKSLEGAIITDPKVITEETKKRLGLLIGKYIK
jgi:5'-methylthioadenosine phosphorylase